MPLMALRARQDQRIRRGSQRGIGPVELKPGGAAAGQAEIADGLVLDAVEDPRGARVCGAWHAAIIGSLEQALGREADPTQQLRRTVVTTPQAAIPTVERVIIFPRL